MSSVRRGQKSQVFAVHRTGDNEAMAMSADAKISEPIIRDYSIVRGLGKCDIRGSGSAGLSLSDY